MSDAMVDGVFVMLCDWRGRCTWTKGGDLPVQVGEFVWEKLSDESKRQAKLAIGQVVAARETRHLEVVGEHGDRYRGWLWPLDSPEVAVCILGMRIPRTLGLLTERERECLANLAVGMETRQIAERMDVSISTIHTHLKHAREKLGVASIEGLISFAARYCYPHSHPLGALIDSKG